MSQHRPTITRPSPKGRPRTIRTLGLLASVLVAIACTGRGNGNATLEAAGWALATYDSAGSSASVPAHVRADARFENGRVTGSTGCNTYQATYTRMGSKLTVGPVAATRRFCEEPAASVETAFLAHLARAASFAATPERLVIFDDAGRTLLDFSAAPLNPLVGSWQVIAYNNGAGGVVSVAIGTELTARFGEDGAVSGSGGCNAYQGSYVATGETLSVGPLATTQRACGEETMAQETRFLAALQAVVGHRLQPGGVALLFSDGSTGVVLGP